MAGEKERWEEKEEGKMREKKVVMEAGREVNVTVHYGLKMIFYVSFVD